MASNDIGDWFRSIPRITKFWFVGSIVLPIAARFGLLSPIWLILRYEFVVYKFQIWRLLTSVLYYPTSGPQGFHYLLNLYFLYSYSVRLETGTFLGRPADYVTMLCFNWICLILIGLTADLLLLMDPMVLSVLYIWCQLNKDTTVTFWFGTRFPAMYLPWVLLGFNLIVGDGYKYFPSHQTWAGFGEAPRRRFTNGNQGGEGGHTWGRGQTLGGN
uniref:Derlin n=1 Tax=Octopus bimaculoides TaxID=37653 RepID=A0A0L8GRN5_OCTBM